MVERIPQIKPVNPARVDEAKEAMDDEEERRQGGGEDEGGDEFEKRLDKTDWRLWLDKQGEQLVRMTVPVNDVAQITFNKVNLKTNPSLLNLRVVLRDGAVYRTALMSLARHQAMSFQGMTSGTLLKATELAPSGDLELLIPEHTSEEITRLTKTERTFSQTLKTGIRKTWMQILGVRDPDTNQTYEEVAWVYVIAFTVIGAIVFGIAWIML